MNTFLSLPALRIGYRKVALLGSFALLASTFQSFAQTSVLFQTFGDNQTADNNFPYATSNVTNTGTGVNTGVFTVMKQNGATTFAYGIRLANSGNGNLGSTQLDFVRKIFAAGSGAVNPNTVSFEIGSYDAKGNDGFNTTSTIDVFANVDNTSFIRIARVIGSVSSPLYPLGYNGTGNAQEVFTDYKVNNIATVSNTNRVTKVTVNLPSSNTAGTSVIIRIIIRIADRAEIVVDNVSLTSGDNLKPLPVELTRFDATAKGQNVDLNWATASEKNSDRFEVQRSATGGTFETVGTVKGQGNTSSAHNYAFVDSRPLAGRSYYRLRQVDTDGTTAYSPVATVQLRNELAVYPNPSAGIVTLPATLGDVHYRLLNTIGQTLLSGQATGNDQLDLTKLAKGTFFLELTGEAGRTTQRLVRE